MALSPVQSHSRWSEWSEDRGRLVLERGWLAGAGLDLAGGCAANWRWELQLNHLQGRLPYQGQSSRGAPLQTHSEWREQALDLTALHALASSPLQVGARVIWSRQRRDIGSAGAVQGYPEQYRQAGLAAGLRWRAALATHWQWQAQAWLGRFQPSRIAIEFPTADPTVLRSGSGRMAELGLGLEWQIAGQPWAAQFGLDWQQQHRSQGAAQPLYRGGLLVGVASQPAHTELRTRLSAGLAYRF
ncbi:hypothetical protein [Pelomonas sp. SE-A7]|uniref:hypothetical protein n=1 Tax=Pelomonas sp. SE-A7 TaxID=3054953 RepID=UPI00259CA9C5|nr:hypothetical protein [Pelomonas sp. SE-A7]MDM4766713.1 hypothetical protein [Pelomonas sp. SE-A7]